ncbi:MAG TPA: CPBP family intramembrane metalloprotease [Pirellulaceae bacterium]|nr:CPBP family intramembrane metalloprotease [Pirellulaceae bacterium]
MDEESVPTSDQTNPPRLSFGVVAAAEAGLVLVAILLYVLGVRNPHHPMLGTWTDGQWLAVLLWGIGGVVPIVLLLFALDRLPGKLFERMRRDTCDWVKSMFSHLSLFQMAIIALLAGICEELLFRWVLQDGLAYRLGGDFGWLISWIAVSLLFGLAHFMNATYFAVASVIGFWLGGLMIWSNTWWAPAIAHALYDFVALCYLTNRLPGFRRDTKSAPV